METYFAHSTAYLDDHISIGANTKIWHFSHIMEHSRIGKNCNIGQNVVIAPEVIVGNNVKIQNNVSLYTGVICEDDVFLGPSCVFTNVMNPRSEVVRKSEFRQTIVRKGATIGANATIVCGVEIGTYGFVGAGAVITKNVNPYELWVGNPSKCIGWMSEKGMRLSFENETAICSESGEKYRLQNNLVTKISE